MAAGEQITVEVQADNPGQGLLHCPNLSHAEAGMVATMSYVQ